MRGNALPALGWVFEVSENRLGGNPFTRRYYVAVVDEVEALSVVRRKAETANPTIRVRRKISDPKMLSLLNLKSGQSVRLPR
jgi:hypothetical protein